MRSSTSLARGVAATIFLTLGALSFADSVLDFSTARDRSMGGTHVALADSSSVLLTNPAGLADLPSSYSVADLSLQAMGPVFDLASLALNGSSGGSSGLTSALSSLLANNNGSLYAGAQLSGPLALGFTGNGLGFGLYNKTLFSLDAASINSITITAQEVVLLVGGYAVRFDLGNGHELDAGLTAKGFVIGSEDPSMDFLAVTSLIQNPSSLLSEPFNLTTGVGVDLGLRWAWKDYSAGIAYRDAYSPALETTYSSLSSFASNSSSAKQGSSSYTTLGSSLDTGVAWTPYLGSLSTVFDSLTVALDYHDILDLFSVLPRNPILNVGLGAEVKALDIVSVRAGISDALLNAGIGLDLSIFKMNLAVFGTELGVDPGNRPCYNLLLDFDFAY